MIRALIIALLALCGCATPPREDARVVAMLLCADGDANTTYRVNGRVVPSDALVAAAKSAGAAVIVQADPDVRYGDVTDLLLRLQLAGLYARDVVVLERGAIECSRR